MTGREKAAADAALAAMPTGVLRRVRAQSVVTSFEVDEAAGTWSVEFDITYLGPAEPECTDTCLRADDARRGA